MARPLLTYHLTKSSCKGEASGAKGEEKVSLIALSKLTPNRFGSVVNPVISPKDLTCLTRSIEEHGIQTPLVVWKTGARLIIVAGMTRYKIARKLRLATVPVLIRHFTHETEAKLFAMTDNLARRQLTTAQKAMLAIEYQKLIAVGRGRRTDLGPSSEMTEVDSHRTAATWAGVSTGTMASLRKVIESDDTALLEEVLSGRLKISAAVHHLRQSRRPQATKPLLCKATVDHTPVYTCVEGDSADLIASAATLYLIPGMVIADVTYGRGVFWQKVNLSPFQFLPTDLLTTTPAVDFRRLPYPDKSLDVVVLDPPFQHDANVPLNGSFYQGRSVCRGLSHPKLMQLYAAGMEEARRVLRKKGLLWVKCGDEVSSGRQQWSHIEVYTIGRELNLYALDLFILKRRQVVPPQVLPQQHARKNHSFLWVLRKTE